MLNLEKFINKCKNIIIRKTEDGGIIMERTS